MIRNIDLEFPNPSDKILVDANILLMIACPLGTRHPNTIKAYSRFLAATRKSKIQLYFSSLILSEFANAWLRLEFASYRLSNPHIGPNDFKAIFRPSQACEDAMKDIHQTIKHQVLAFVKPIDDQFKKLRIDDFFHLGLDVNDAHSVALSKKEGFSILTDDADFSVARNELDIWTWNRKLLKP